ncbi:hypothetical protein SBDP1_350006 [Syntrophobacter sp. SbD1]|nr:hypothetical protein SBDP1_350006 [Syntrophobacter sp. SbD1]
MLLLLGLFLGYVLGYIVACLCNVAREETPNIQQQPAITELSKVRLIISQ